MTAETPERHPPSCLYVEYVLYHCGPMTTAELVDESGLPEGTVRYALDRLAKETGTLSRHCDPTDGRQVRWNISDDR